MSIYVIFLAVCMCINAFVADRHEKRGKSTKLNKIIHLLLSLVIVGASFLLLSLFTALVVTVLILITDIAVFLYTK